MSFKLGLIKANLTWAASQNRRTHVRFCGIDSDMQCSCVISKVYFHMQRLCKPAIRLVYVLLVTECLSFICMQMLLVLCMCACFITIVVSLSVSVFMLCFHCVLYVWSPASGTKDTNHYWSCLRFTLIPWDCAPPPPPLLIPSTSSRCTWIAYWIDGVSNTHSLHFNTPDNLFFSFSPCPL